jgi:hypothetical protein
MPQIVLRTGDVLEGEIVSIGEPRLAVIREDRMVELEASQIQRIEGVQPGLTLPRGLQRVSHYRRVFFDVEPNGTVTRRGTMILIGADADRTAANRSWDEFLGREPESEYGVELAWEVQFSTGTANLEVSAFDEFGQELRVRKIGRGPCNPGSGRDDEGHIYKLELEVPVGGEWPAHVQTTIVLRGESWAREIEPGVWELRDWEHVGPTPELHEVFVRLPLGAQIIETTPPARRFADPRGRAMCRWKQCVFAGTPFDHAVRYEMPVSEERPREECRVPARTPQGPTTREARHVEEPVAEAVPLGSR